MLIMIPNGNLKQNNEYIMKQGREIQIVVWIKYKLILNKFLFSTRAAKKNLTFMIPCQCPAFFESFCTLHMKWC